jgi:hypothetical protein
VRKISELMSYPGGIAIVDKPSNFQEIREQSIDSAKLRALGWTPRFTLEDGLKACIASPEYGAEASAARSQAAPGLAVERRAAMAV